MWDMGQVLSAGRPDTRWCDSRRTWISEADPDRVSSSAPQARKLGLDDQDSIQGGLGLAALEVAVGAIIRSIPDKVTRRVIEQELEDVLQMLDHEIFGCWVGMTLCTAFSPLVEQYHRVFPPTFLDDRRNTAREPAVWLPSSSLLRRRSRPSNRRPAILGQSDQFGHSRAARGRLFGRLALGAFAVRHHTPSSSRHVGEVIFPACSSRRASTTAPHRSQRP